MIPGTNENARAIRRAVAAAIRQKERSTGPAIPTRSVAPALGELRRQRAVWPPVDQHAPEEGQVEGA